MTYSGTKSFNLTIEEIIEEAFERCGLEVLSGYDLKTARRSLNLIFSEWANRGLNLWTISYGTQTMTAGLNYYNIPVDVVDILDGTITTTGASDGATTNLPSDSSTTDVTITKISNTEYMNLSRKEQQAAGDARPTQFSLVAGKVSITESGVTTTYGRPENPMALFVYPSPNTDYIMKYFYIGRIEDAGGYTNYADVPFFFLPCLTAALAYYMAVKRAPSLAGGLKTIYEEEFQRAANSDRERVSFRVRPAQAYIP
jgi:hypothetical protein|tara:strand:+ start:1469 stop:2236 length:768 start_codon:yes stop_codon:yes gene_type:complete